MNVPMTDSTSDPVSPAHGSSHQQEAVSPALRRRLQVCFEHGSQLAKEKDYDYAHEILSECVTKDPSNLVYVEAMLSNLQKKFDNNKKGARFKGFGGKGAFKKTVQRKDWAEVLQMGPEFLKMNPWDVTTLRGLAHACAASHYNEVELRYLKNALDANPKDIEVNRHCAHSLARMGQYDQAIACWHRIEELTKGDDEAPKKISELTLEKTRGSTGIADDAEIAPSEKAAEKSRSEPVKPTPVKAASAKPALQPAEPTNPSKPVEQPRIQIRLNPRQKLEKAIHDNPIDIDNYVALAELHTTEGRYGEAVKVLTRALAAAGSDLKLHELLENAQIRHSRAQVAIAERQAATTKTPEAAELVKRLRSDLNRQELDVFAARNQRHPEDTGVQHELGIRLKRAGNYAEAIKYLESVREDPQHKTAATLELGECLQQLRKFPQALECYVSAVQLAMDEPERKKLALFRAGVLALGLKDAAGAVRHLSALVDIDPNYRDAADRLDKARKIGQT